MDANAFRHLYGYHFHENRQMWEQSIVGLSQDQFTQEVAYSLGSVRNHIVHLISVDDVWFSDLRGVTPADWLDPAQFTDRALIRAYWDNVEQAMQAYLAELQDDMLFSTPLTNEEDRDLTVWQVLLQVINHGTDHRAQLLRLLHDLGEKTRPQDYIFYAYDHPPNGASPT